MLMLKMWMVIMIMFMVGNMIFVSSHKHLLIVLLSFEFIVLSIFYFLLMFLSFVNNDMYMY